MPREAWVPDTWPSPDAAKLGKGRLESYCNYHVACFAVLLGDLQPDYGPLNI